MELVGYLLGLNHRPRPMQLIHAAGMIVIPPFLSS